MKKYISLLIVLSISIGITWGQIAGRHNRNIGSNNEDFVFTDIYNTSRSSNEYGLPSNELNYFFTLERDMDIKISTCENGSELWDNLPSTIIYLLDEFGNLLVKSEYDQYGEGGCSYTRAFLKAQGLKAGSYQLIVEGKAGNGYITTTLTATVVTGIPGWLYIGEKIGSFTLTSTKNTTDYYPQTFTHIFTLKRPMDVIISHCGSEVKDTYLELLGPMNDKIAYNDDYTGAGQCVSNTNSYLKITNLPEGTYNVVSRGKYAQGNITTTIQGVSQTVKGEFDLGQKESNFTYKDTKNTEDYSNTYGQPTGDFTYKFTLTKVMDIVISHCGSTVNNTYLHLLNSSGTRIAYNDDYTGTGKCSSTFNSYLKMTNLSAGTYYVVSEGYSQDGYITTSIQGILPLMKGEYNLEAQSTSFNYTDIKNTALYTNSYGQSTGDFTYKFTLNKPMDVIISHCGSEVKDTYLHLLNSSGTRIAYNDNYTGTGQCSSTTNAYLKMTSLAAGTYSVVSEGNTQNGNVTTSIQGILPVTLSLSNSQNYVHTRIYQDEAGSEGLALDVIQYFDGLGRPEQTVQRGITPNGNDLVSLQEYDEFGRDSNTWLPAAIAGNNGAFAQIANIKEQAKITNTNIGMSDQNPYSKPIYENSPLNRVLKQFGPGQEWHNNEKAVSTGYLTNTYQAGTSLTTSDSLVCALYMTVDDRGLIKITRTNNYNAGELYVTRIKDEDGNTSYEFKDKLGQIILSRQVDGTELLNTYYVYDSFGNLRVVIPPRAADILLSSSTGWTDTDTNMQQLCYLYKYDSRNRCISKKIPGTEWVSYVYDKADRLIFTQDGEQKSKGEWMFSIPDEFERIVLTGICKNTNINNAAYENILVSAKYTGSGINGYTITNFTPAVGYNLLSTNYYDDYKFRSLTTTGMNNAELNYLPEADYGTQRSGAQGYEHKGLLTGTITTLFGGDLDKKTLSSVMYYDDRARLVQTKSTNHLNGTEKEYIAYNFIGQPIRKKHVHSATGKTTQTELYTYTYDHAGRLKETKHKLNSQPEISLAKIDYDDLGRMKKNTKGGNNNLYLDYMYNVRSWTNVIANDNYFRTHIHYNEYVSNVNNDRLYNGNISFISYFNPNDSWKVYKYSYDNLSRLTSAFYNGPEQHKYGEGYTYDKHGNILTLDRNGRTKSGEVYGLVDQLKFEYKNNGNQLIKVTDVGKDAADSHSNDFKDYADATKYGTAFTEEYGYNRNGAMTKDLNKGISDIQYNSLNLPVLMDINSPGAEARTKYTYSATGAKLRTYYQWNSDREKSPVNASNYKDILGKSVNTAFGYLDKHKTTDYAGNIVYESISDGTSKTRILVDGGYIENGEYYFFLSDHLGNNRIVVKADGTQVQRNDYYPFGMAFADRAETEQNLQPYKYNGKELDQTHGLNQYDYSARYYDPAIGRFTTVDPLAEKYYSISPYVYCANNPIKFIDPTGMYYVASPVFNQDGELIGTDDEGLDGDPIIMDEKNFTQGMSHLDALSFDLGLNALNDYESLSRFYTNFSQLSKRPDYDGYLTPEEAEAWYKEGGGQPLYVDVSKINLGGAWASNFKIGEEKGYNFFLMSPKNYDTARVYGTLAITLLDDKGTASLVPSRLRDSGQIDKYNFDQHPGQPLRNLQTSAARKYVGAGTAYNIYGYGTAKLSTAKWYNPLRMLSPY